MPPRPKQDHRILRWPLLAGICLWLAACGTGGPAYDAPGPGVAATVDLTGALVFSPAELTVQVGDKVEWRNQTVITHTVTADARVAADPAHIALPEGARPFNSAAIPAGQIFRYTFTVPGTYRYVCLPHEGQKMFGTVVVEPKT
jgi:plastocyanin